MGLDRQSLIEFILDHFERPRNRGTLAGPTVTMKGGNPGCGDIVHLQLRLDDDERIADVAFEGEGCTISQAAASLLTEKIKGRPLADAAALSAEDFVAELGYEIVANRLKCATLALSTLKAAEQKFRRGQRQAQVDGGRLDRDQADSDEVVNF
jgi:nitrogen fixation NifU-like protein